MLKYIYIIKIIGSSQWDLATAEASWIFDEKFREKIVYMWELPNPAALFTNALYLLSMKNWLNKEVIRKLYWKTVQAFSVRGNTILFYNQMIKKIHLILANFLLLELIFTIAYWNNKLQNLKEISFHPQEV